MWNPVRPCSPDQLKANVRYAIGLGLPSAEVSAPRAERLHIYASGPSLRTADIQWPCMALNGALGEFTRRGLCPTWWVACDPQGIVKSFLTDQVEPLEGYFVASRCDMAVFDALQYRAVTLWHLADEAISEFPDDVVAVPDAASVTISSLFLASMIGFQAITVHGWDGCYTDNISHADGHDDGKKRITVECNGRQFVTNTSWLVERDDASRALAMLYTIDVEITGSGLMAVSLAPLLSDIRNIREGIHNG